MTTANGRRSTELRPQPVSDPGDRSRPKSFFPRIPRDGPANPSGLGAHTQGFTRARPRDFSDRRVCYDEDDRILAFYYLDEVMDEYPESRLFYTALQKQFEIADALPQRLQAADSSAWRIPAGGG